MTPTLLDETFKPIEPLFQFEYFAESVIFLLNKTSLSFDDQTFLAIKNQLLHT
jgi:hypothetical protein